MNAPLKAVGGARVLEVRKILKTCRIRSLCALCVAVFAAVPLASAGMADDATLSGVVRDVHGVPQMGALVRLMTGDATSVATAFTDAHGRYIIPAVLPGNYRLQATAAFLVPASRSNIRLRAGAQAIVNLTMSALYDAANWLPARDRRSDEPADDWKWTLRSNANRPLLRLVDPQDESGIVYSSSAETQHHASTRTRVAVSGGNTSFASGGLHNVVVVDRSHETGDSSILRADIGGPRTPYPVDPAVEVLAGYERQSPFGGATRLVATLQSHPELVAGLGSDSGTQVMQIASTQEYHFGDLVALDVGSLVRADRMQGTRLSASPFVRVEARPASGTLLEYRYARSPDLQSSADLDRLKSSLRVLSAANGRPLSTSGGQHALVLTHKLGTRTLQTSAYLNHLDHASLKGVGLLTRSDLAGAAIIVDPTTASFILAGDRLSAHGISILISQPLTTTLSASFSGDLGTVLVAGPSGAGTLAAPTLGRRSSYAAAAELRGKLLRTGTSIRAGYRWQPERSLTTINAFTSDPADTYLGFAVRQRLLAGRWLPQGVDVMVEATNLLDQGNQSILANDGKVLLLSAYPRTVQGGFAFNF